MSKDDYFVLVYKLLRYLYRCLKEGTPVQFKETTGLAITPKGIAYLEENSTMKRVQEFLGPTGEIANMVISRFM